MCGFFGMLSFSGEVNKSDSFLKYALKDLSRRGPDDCGIWRDKNVLLGFRRLSIRDLSEAGNQPMVSSNGNFVIVYNGEIYNISELITWAQIDTTQLRGQSDTEVLLLSFEKKGIRNTLERLDGIFSIALYDIQHKSITLTRDHAGIKPLYYGYSNDGVVFSSHYHLVTAHPYFSTNKVQPAALYNYFKYGFIQEGEGLLMDTCNLPHGHFITLSEESASSWTPYVDPHELYETGDIVPTVKELSGIYKNVVESQLVSDVPVGTFLSGGVDSTITSAFADECKKGITAFTIGVDDPALDESVEATRFAGYFKLNHVVKNIDEKTIADLMDDYDGSMAEPLADYSSLMTLKVCELAKEQFTVALSGDGGDELFWGYPRFREATKYISFFNSSRLSRLFQILKGRVDGIKIPVQLLRFKNFNQYYLSKQGIPGSEYWTGLLMNKGINPELPLIAKLIKKDGSAEKSAMLYARTMEYHIHLQRVLLKVDRASMYHSLEVRVPILSRKMINISKKYQYTDCVDNTKAKLPLRKLLSSLLPPGAADSGSKKGFTPPLNKWLRGTLKERFEKRLFYVPEIFSNLIDVNIIQRMWNEHQSGKKDWTWMIWSIYSLFTWTEQKMLRTKI
jgi:asparagine synthase (glutamine-hydrolysing)